MLAESKKQQTTLFYFTMFQCIFTYVFKKVINYKKINLNTVKDTLFYCKYKPAIGGLCIGCGIIGGLIL